MTEFKWIWGYLKRYRYLILVGLIMNLSAAALSMVNPYMTGSIVDDVINAGKTSMLAGILVIMIGVTLIKTVIRYGFQVIFEHVSQSVFRKIREEIYQRLQVLDFGFFDRTRTGDIMARMTGDMEAIRHFISGVIPAFFENVMIFIFAICMLFTVNYKLALVTMCLTPFVAFFAIRLSIKVKPAFSAIREQFSRLNTVVQENISGNRVVKAFAREDHEIDKFSVENESFRQKGIAASEIWQKYLPVLDSLAGSMSVAVILFGGVMVINGTITLGQMVTFNGFIWALSNPLRMVGWLLNDVQRFAASAEKVRVLMLSESSIQNKAKCIQTDRINGYVEFKNVSFSYGDEKVLQNINFKAKPGQTVAIIGPTGSGKSTLTNLICRFYDCDGGQVLVDGVNVKELDVRKLRENISVAMQDIFLFSDTIESNIAYGMPDAPMEQVKWAAEIAGAHDFIMSFHEGYDTIIGERGVGLSGGQRQRIALARALLKNPSILILDDTTSSVDIETEHEIHKALKSFYREKTTFVIAHRISSVKNADLILVLDEGRIVEQGCHEELLEARGYYYSVFQNQFGDFDQMHAAEVV